MRYYTPERGGWLGAYFNQLGSIEVGSMHSVTYMRVLTTLGGSDSERQGT